MKIETMSERTFLIVLAIVLAIIGLAFVLSGCGIPPITSQEK